MTNDMEMKSQSALEYLMIIALTIAIILPTTYLFFTYSSESNLKILDSQISQIGRGIIDTAETVYFSGEGSKIILEISMPRRVADVYILHERELVFNLTTEIGEMEMVFFSAANLTSQDCIENKCKLSELSVFGPKKVKLESFNGGRQVIITNFKE